jgi:hypothetical protein
MKTKIFSVILILFSFTVTAQNWKTINSNDTTYFTIDAPTGPDSLWHGFLSMCMGRFVKHQWC